MAVAQWTVFPGLSFSSHRVALSVHRYLEGLERATPSPQRACSFVLPTCHKDAVKAIAYSSPTHDFLLWCPSKVFLPLLSLPATCCPAILCMAGYERPANCDWNTSFLSYLINGTLNGQGQVRPLILFRYLASRNDRFGSANDIITFWHHARVQWTEDGDLACPCPW